MLMQKSSKSTDLSKNCDGLTRFLWSRQEGCCRGDTGHPATLLLLVHLLPPPTPPPLPIYVKNFCIYKIPMSVKFCM